MGEDFLFDNEKVLEGADDFGLDMGVADVLTDEEVGEFEVRDVELFEVIGIAS